MKNRKTSPRSTEQSFPQSNQLSDEKEYDQNQERDDDRLIVDNRSIIVPNPTEFSSADEFSTEGKIRSTDASMASPTDEFVIDVESSHTLQNETEYITDSGKNEFLRSTLPVDQAIPDKLDDLFVGSIEQRLLHVVPGDIAIFHVTVLNNTMSVASFNVRIEGWLPLEWVDIVPTHTRLQPGERMQFDLVVSPPRLAATEAGARPFAIVIRSPDYVGRRTQLGAKLIVQPFHSFTLAKPRPNQLHITWHERSVTTSVPLTNQSNVTTEFCLDATDQHHTYWFEFLLPETNIPQGGRAMVSVEAGQTIYLPLRITTQAPSFISLFRKSSLFRVVAQTSKPNKNGQAMMRTVATTSLGQHSHKQDSFEPYSFGQEREAQRVVYGRLTASPLIGPGLVTLLTSSILLILLAIGTAGLFTLMTLMPRDLGQRIGQSSLVEAAPAALEIIVKVAEPVPTSTSRQQVNGQPAENTQLGTGGPLSRSPPGPGSETIQTNREQQNQQTSTEHDRRNAPTTENHPQSVQTGVVQDGDRVIQPSDIQAPQTTSGVLIVQPEMITQPGDDNVAPNTPGGNRNTETIIVVDPQANSATNGQVGESQISHNNATNSRTEATASTTMTYEELFQLVGREYELDWRILAAQAYVESSFDPLALGSRGDLGLMQILPTTWKEWAPRVNAVDPFDSYSNVLVAAAYLDHMRSIFSAQGYVQEEWMLIAYNWGPDKLRNFLNGGQNWDDLDEARKKYARDILRIAESLPPK
ncbi:transglycosylase SLT domain-containing protein [Chloroflexi bacterium TSY]|nr:transglycosylase SLT domain-containing protein [Chloroflexi bacterium TSY]